MTFGQWGSLPPSLLAALFGVAVVAGCIDAIAGGGGLLCWAHRLIRAGIGLF